MTKIVDIRTRMTPNWLEKGKAALESIAPDDRETIIAFVFNIVVEDLKAGLRGKKADVFFQIIIEEFEKANPHKGCYFSDDVDGNAVPFNNDTKVCPLCAVKIRNVLLAFGIDIEKPKNKTLH